MANEGRHRAWATRGRTAVIGGLRRTAGFIGWSGFDEGLRRDCWRSWRRQREISTVGELGLWLCRETSGCGARLGLIGGGGRRRGGAGGPVCGGEERRLTRWGRDLERGVAAEGRRRAELREAGGQRGWRSKRRWHGESSTGAAGASGLWSSVSGGAAGGSRVWRLEARAWAKAATARWGQAASELKEATAGAEGEGLVLVALRWPEVKSATG